MGFMEPNIEPVPETAPTEEELKAARRANSLANLKQNRKDQPDTEVVGEEAPLDLAGDMLHVYTKPYSKDRTQGQKDCRKWKNKDTKGFMAALALLVKKKADGAAKGLEEAQEADEGSKKALTLIDELLTDWEASDDSK